MNNCPDIQDALMQGAALSEDKRAHLESCPLCIEFAEVLDSVPPLETAEPAPAIDQQVRHAADTFRLNRRRSRHLVLTLAAACVAFGMVLIYVRTGRAPSTAPGFEQPIVLHRQPTGEITEAHVAAALDWDEDMDDALLNVDAELTFDEYEAFYAALAALE
jgi:hypothetical protein